MNVTYSTFSGNSVNSQLFTGFGGGISNNSTGTVSVTKSTLSGNSAVGSNGRGGGISNIGEGTVNVTNSTLSGNSAINNREFVDSGQGGGIYNSFTGTVNVTNSALSGNSARSNFGQPGEGGGIYNSTGAPFVITGLVNVKNTIIALNTASTSGPDVFGTSTDMIHSFTSQGYNLIGNADGNTDFTGPGDKVGTNAAPLDPLLGPLADNGGPTLTMALLAGSHAIDKGGPATGVTTDQRGLPRPVDDLTIPNAAGGDGSDIGAFEAQPSPTPCQTVSGITPASGAVGSTVTITGTNFTGVTAVKFSSNITAAFTVNSDSQITATVPGGAATGPITISKPNCTDVPTGTFTVTPLCTPPSITTQPSSQTVLTSQTARLNVVANGTGPLTYQWYKGTRGDTTNPINGATSSAYITQALSNFDRTSYWVRVQDICGASVNSDATSVVTTDKRPLIFVPGIAGSVLKEGDRELWTGPISNLINCPFDDLTLDPSKPQATIIASDIVSTAFSLKDIYGTLLTNLTKSESLGGGGYRIGNNQTLFLVPYDWRKTNVLAAASLGSMIDNVRTLFPSMNVDVLAHSMGGMVAQRYVMDNISTHHVSKVITIGTPWLGAAKAINVLETGQFLDEWGLFCTGSIKTLAEYFTGMHELLPSSKYFDLSILPPFGESGWDIDKDGNAFETYNYNNLVVMLDGRYPFSSPGINSFNFHRLPGQDDGTLAPSNISYYHIYGWQRGDGTIGQVVATLGIRCGGQICYPSNYIDLKMTAGDGTVPVVSATRQGRGQKLNEPKHQLLQFIATNSSDNSKVDHVGLCSNPDVVARVISTLSSTGLSTAQTQGVMGLLDQSSEPAFYLQVIGNPSITISDPLGNTSTLTNSSLGSNVPGVNAYIMGDKAFMVVLATDQTYTITMQTSSEPLSINLTQGTEEATTQAIRYRDIMLPVNVAVKLRVTPQGPDPLKYDKNRDGTFSETVPPTASVTGSAAQDLDPPAVNISGIVQSSGVQVSITATDSGSGINAIYYSLDGSTFQKYAAPFSVDFFNGPAVYAFADDNVANRSSLVTYYPSISSNQIDNAQFFVRQHYLDFLNREPDPGGLGYWTDQITRCGTDAACIDSRRVGISAAFFIELEFQQTGYVVYRLYRAAYGTLPGAATRANLLYSDFMPDRSQLIAGPQLPQSTIDFANRFVQRAIFKQAYPDTMSPAEFVNKLFDSAGLNNQAERQQAIQALNNGSKTRAQVLLDLIEISEFKTREYNPAFVLMQYFGYLRRDPDQGGYNFWLGIVNNPSVANYRSMVCAFLTSREYQERFSPVVTRNDQICANVN